MLLPDYVLIGPPRRYIDGRGNKAKHYAQRFRLLTDSTRSVRSVSLKTKDGAAARRRAVSYVEARIRENILKVDPLSRTAANGISQVFQEYVEDLVAVGNTQRQANLVKHRIERVITIGRFTTYAQLDSVQATKAIAALQERGEFKTTASANRCSGPQKLDSLIRW